MSHKNCACVTGRLRNDYGAIARIVHETGEPIYTTRNGEGDVVLMSNEAFEERGALNERI